MTVTTKVKRERLSELIKACPTCGTPTLRACWHHNPGRGGTVLAVEMTRGESAELLGESIKQAQVEVDQLKEDLFGVTHITREA